MAQDRAAANHMVQLTGQMGVPVTEINGNFIVGFNQPALKAAVTQLKAKRQENGVKLGAQVADAAKLLNQPGAVLGKIRPGSLAEKAGLREGDIITSLNGQPVNNSADLALALQKLTAQSPLPEFKVKRDGQFI